MQYRLADRRKEGPRLLYDEAIFCIRGSACMGLVEALMDRKSLISEDTKECVRDSKAAKRFREYVRENQSRIIVLDHRQVIQRIDLGDLCGRILIACAATPLSGRVQLW